MLWESEDSWAESFKNIKNGIYNEESVVLFSEVNLHSSNVELDSQNET